MRIKFDCIRNRHIGAGIGICWDKRLLPDPEDILSIGIDFICWSYFITLSRK